MTHVLACPPCGREVRLPDDAAGKRFRCKGCDTLLSIREAGDGGLALVARCAGCGADLPEHDAFCTACGAPVSGRSPSPSPSADAAPAVPRPARHRRRVGDRTRRKSIGRATGWVLAVAIMFAVFGTVMGFITAEQADQAHANFSRFESDELVELMGETQTAAEWHRRFDAETRGVFLVNYVLAAVMLGLWFWARRSAFPALLTALCVYLAVIVLNVAVDPGTLLQGLLIKILVISALGLGVKAAVGQRAAEREAEGPAA